MALAREKSIAYTNLVGNPEGKRLLGTARRRWMNNIKIVFRETGWGGMN
jgi:hypothetical protein